MNKTLLDIVNDLDYDLTYYATKFVFNDKTLKIGADIEPLEVYLKPNTSKSKVDLVLSIHNLGSFTVHSCLDDKEISIVNKSDKFDDGLHLFPTYQLAELHYQKRLTNYLTAIKKKTDEKEKELNNLIQLKNKFEGKFEGIVK